MFTVAEGLLETHAAPVPTHLQKPRLRRREASEYLRAVHGLQYEFTTLSKLACIGGGPLFQKAGRWPLYTPAELDRWAMAKLGVPLANTSQLAA